MGDICAFCGTDMYLPFAVSTLGGPVHPGCALEISETTMEKSLSERVAELENTVKVLMDEIAELNDVIEDLEEELDEALDYQADMANEINW